MKLINVNGVFKPVVAVNNPQGPQKQAHKTILQSRTEVAKLDAALKGDLSIAIHRSRGGLGDMLFVTPLAKAFKQKYPKASLTFVTDYSYSNGELVDLLRWNPYIDFVIPNEILDKSEFNAVIDVTGPELKVEVEYKSFPTRTEIWARLIGLPLVDGKGIYIVTSEEALWANKLFMDWRNTYGRQAKFIGVQVRSNDPKRTWPLKNLLEMITYVNSKRNDIVWVLMDSESPKVSMKNTINFFGYGIRALGAVIDKVDLFLGPDSALTHLAGCLNKRLVSLFGSMPPEARIKPYPNAKALFLDNLACLRCVYKGCIHPTFKCMEDMKYSMVWPAIEQSLNAPFIPLELEKYQDSRGPMIVQQNKVVLHGSGIRTVEI